MEIRSSISTATATAQDVIDALNNDTGGLVTASGFNANPNFAFDGNAVITGALYWLFGKFFLIPLP